jgi:Flp pilus assembly protein TadD
MFKDFKSYGVGLVLSGLLIFPISGLGQDLGSSNGLFRSSNPSTKSAATSKKTPPKTSAKSALSKKTAKTPANKTSGNSSNNSAKSIKKSSKSDNETAKTTTNKIEPTKTLTSRPPQNEIVINVGQKTSGDFDELFEQAIDEGNTARDNRNYGGAESAYRRAQSLKPKDSRAIYGLGNLYSDQQRWEEAERAYRQSIQLEPGSPEAHIALSFVLTQPVVGTNLGDRYTQAEKMARKAILLDENNAVAYDQLGVALELRGIIEQETQNAYRRAIQLDPSFALAYAHLGRLLRRNGLVNESSAAYRDAIRLANDVPTMILVADVMQSQQRFAESEQLLRKALREDPKNPTALFLLGRALTIRANFDEAERVLKTSLEVSPNSFVSYALLGSLYARHNKFEDAEKILMKAIQVISNNERRRLSQEFEFVGDGFMRVGKRQDAARLYRQAIALDGDKSLLMSKLNKAQKS